MFFYLIALAFGSMAIGRRLGMDKKTVFKADLQNVAERETDLQDVAQRVQEIGKEFHFKKGKMHNFGLVDCNKLMANNVTCFANNPSSPYGLVMVPPPDGKSEDLGECWGPWKPICYPNDAGEMMTLPYHLDSSEAIIVLGVTPPEVKYFGFDNYIYERTYPQDFEIDPEVATLSRCWEEGSTNRRCDVFASLGDSLNYGNLRPHGEGVGAFSRQFAMVVSPSKTTFKRIAELLQEAGISAVNEHPIPGEIMNLGFEQGKDTFATLLRTAFPASLDSYNRWLENPSFIVLRATPKKSSTPSLYPQPGYCGANVGVPPPPGAYCLTKRSLQSEADRVGTTMDKLLKAQKALINIVQSRVRISSWNSHTTHFKSGVPDSGLLCLEKGQKCNGDTRATYYPVSSKQIQDALIRGAILSKLRSAFGFAPLTKQEMADKTWRRSARAFLTSSYQDTMYVVGVVHSATNAGVYSSISVYDLWWLKGIMAIVDSQLVGSAEPLLQGTEYEDVAKYLYVAKFTRGDCAGDQFCFNVPSTGNFSIPEDTPLLFIERMYYEPTTHVGIDGQGVVPAAVVHNARQFSGKKRIGSVKSRL